MRTLLYLLLILLPLFAISQETPRIGATAMPGLLEPQQPNEHVRLQKVRIGFKGFQEETTDQSRQIPKARFTINYVFENTSDREQYVPSNVPVKMVFTEFAREHRSLVLDNIAAIVPGLFDLQGNGEQIADDMAAMFEQRNFIRRFMNVRDLGRLNMDYVIRQGKEEIQYQKAELNFEWLKSKKDEEGYLQMTLNQQLDLKFEPRSTTELQFDFLVPAFTVGEYDAQYYVPVATAGASKWAGSIDKMYLTNTVNQATQALPYYFDYSQRMLEEDQSVTIIRDHVPERNERIGFYATKNSGCGCYKGDAQARSVFIPKPIKHISASSWFQNQYSEQQTCFKSSDEVAVFSRLPFALKGLDGTLGFTGNALEVQNHTTNHLRSLAERNCDNEGEPYLTFTKGYHPAWAFDHGSDSLMMDGEQKVNHFTTNTAWCAAGGKGEYLEFETTQLVKEMKFYTGIKSDREKYEKFGRVKMLEVVQQDGDFEKLIVLSDMITSSYKVQMPAGKYRMVIKETYPGVRYDATCLSKIEFTFDAGDQWLESISNKPVK